MAEPNRDSADGSLPGEQKPPAAAPIGRWSNLRALGAAIVFLTRIPLPYNPSFHDPITLRRSTIFFPLVGLLIGGLTATTIFLGEQLWHAAAAVILALAVEALLTGGFHEDALADFCDAFGGGWTREDVLRIMKDSRLGTYGVLGLVFGVSLRVVCLYILVQRFHADQWHVWVVALLASASVGRLAILLAMASIPPIQHRESLAKDIGERLSWKHVVAGALWTLPALALFAYLLPAQFGLAAFSVSVAFVLYLRIVRRKLGGITGDCLGCICYVTQVLILLAAAAEF